MRRLDLVAMVVVVAACDSLANQGRTVLRVEPPIAHAELRDEGKSLHVTLQPELTVNDGAVTAVSMWSAQ